MGIAGILTARHREMLRNATGEIGAVQWSDNPMMQTRILNVCRFNRFTTIEHLRRFMRDPTFTLSGIPYPAAQFGPKAWASVQAKLAEPHLEHAVSLMNAERIDQ